LIALAGCNGAGKSTFYRQLLVNKGLPFVNADEFARELDLGAYEAAELAEEVRRLNVNRRESFIMETVFSDPVGAKLDFLEDAAGHGYQVALFFIGLLFIPESPRYLVAAGKPERAQKVLASVSHPDDAASKVASIRRTLKADHRPRMSDLRLDEGGGIRPIVWVGLCIAALQQLVGINVVFYYGEVLWRAAGFSEGDALLINVIGGFINVSATVGAILLVDKWGRNVPQSDPGCCTLRGGSLPMADQLRRDHDLPHPAWSHRPRRCLRHLLRLRDSGSTLCLEIRARDQGQDPRGNVMAARFFIPSATICDTDGRF